MVRGQRRRLSAALVLIPPALEALRRSLVIAQDSRNRVADGCTNKEIGVRLSVSAFTVKNHLSRAGRRLGARDRSHIVAVAFRAGVLS